MITAMKTWNRPRYLARFVTAVEHGHILVVWFTLAIEESTFWVTELQHIPSTAIRRDFLNVAQSALQHAVRKGPLDHIRLLLNVALIGSPAIYRPLLFDFQRPRDNSMMNFREKIVGLNL